MEIEIDEILDSIGADYSDIGTHLLLKECPSCQKKDKVRVDKGTGKWICHKCFTDDADTGKGNMWTLLPHYGLEKHEIRTLLFGYTLPTYSDDFKFKSAEQALEQEPEIEAELMILPTYFIPMDGTQENYNLFPEAYEYLLTRKVDNINLIKRYKLMYSTLHKRIVFPFFNGEGQLIGWQGRDITDRCKQDHPKCTEKQCELRRNYYFKGEGSAPELCPVCGSLLKDEFYPKTLTSFGFQKQNLLINNNLLNPIMPTCFVEGPFDAINTPNSIPLLGKYLSEIQSRIIRSSIKEVILYFDGDSDGDKATINVYRELEMFVPSIKIVLNNSNEDPGQFHYKENAERLKDAISLENWAFSKKILV
jgi:hypothetical protein